MLDIKELEDTIQKRTKKSDGFEKDSEGKSNKDTKNPTWCEQEVREICPDYAADLKKPDNKQKPNWVDAYQDIARFSDNEQALFRWVHRRPLNLEEFKKISPTPKEQFSRDPCGRTIFTYLKKISESPENEKEMEIANAILNDYYTSFFPENDEKINNINLLTNFLKAIEAEDDKTAKKLLKELPKDIWTDNFNLEDYTNLSVLYYLPNVAFKPPLLSHFNKLGHKKAGDLLQSLQKTRFLKQFREELPPTVKADDVAFLIEARSIQLNSDKTERKKLAKKFFKLNTRPPSSEIKLIPRSESEIIITHESNSWTEQDSKKALSEYLSYERLAYAECIYEFGDPITPENRIEYTKNNDNLCVIEEYLREGHSFTTDQWKTLQESSLRANDFVQAAKKDTDALDRKEWSSFISATNTRRGRPHLTAQDFRRGGLIISNKINQETWFYTNIVEICQNLRICTLPLSPDYKADIPQKVLPLWFALVLGREQQRLLTTSQEDESDIENTNQELKWIMEQAGPESIADILEQITDPHLAALMLILLKKNRSDLFSEKNWPSLKKPKSLFEQYQRLEEAQNKPTSLETELGTFWIQGNNLIRPNKQIEERLSFSTKLKQFRSKCAKLWNQYGFTVSCLILATLSIALAPFILPGILASGLPVWMLATAAGFLISAHLFGGKSLQRFMPKLLALLSIALLITGIAISVFNPVLGIFLLVCATSANLGQRLPTLEQQWRSKADLVINLLFTFMLLITLASGYGIIPIAAIAITAMCVKGLIYLHEKNLQKTPPKEWTQENIPEENVAQPEMPHQQPNPSKAPQAHSSNLPSSPSSTLEQNKKKGERGEEGEGEDERDARNITNR